MCRSSWKAASWQWSWQKGKESSKNKSPTFTDQEVAMRGGA